jgi:3-methyl-2-oxobutanoate hydroxymethyltransferase
MNKWTPNAIKATKGQRKLACLTAYDFATARIMDETGVPLILVGDSLGMTVLGYSDTLPVTMEQVLHHTAAVSRGVKEALVVADMPFMSYQASLEQGISNAGRFLKEAGAGAVKIEGGALREPLVQALVQNGIPVLAHIGLTPQSLREMGGFKVQGRTTGEAKKLVSDAKVLERAGAFAIVLECMPPDVGAAITKEVGIPTIGIGAGTHCDGQILVTPDLLGIHTGVSPKFVKRYAELGKAMQDAFAAYRNEVESGAFPGPEHEY